MKASPRTMPVPFPVPKRIATRLLTFLFLALCATALQATEWQEREVGVAAVDPKTGKILWEAWTKEDVPDDALREVREAVEKLLAASGADDAIEAPPRFPFALNDEQFVDIANREGQPTLVLFRGTPKKPGTEIGRFTMGKGKPKSAVLPWQKAGSRLYVWGEGTIYALSPRNDGHDAPEKEWKPDWTLDARKELLGDRPEAPLSFYNLFYMCVLADENGICVVHPHGILRVAAAGDKKTVYEIRNPWPVIKNGYGTLATMGRKVIYWRHGAGVVALDQESNEEIWRLETKRGPYPSRVVEIEGGPVLIQVGSDLPLTIQRALTGETHGYQFLGRNTPERRVAAAYLLRAYGDGHLRSSLRSQAAKLQEEGHDAATKAAGKSLTEIVDHWPAKRDRRRLFEGCLDLILAKKTTDPTGTAGEPPPDRVLGWCQMQELVYGTPLDAYMFYNDHFAYGAKDGEKAFPVEKERRDALAKRCREVIATGPKEEIPFAASCLVSRTVSGDGLAEEELNTMFLSDQTGVWRWAGYALARNGARDRLIELAGKRPEGNLLDAIYMLYPANPKTWSAAEREFWKTAKGRLEKQGLALPVPMAWPE